MRAKLFYLLPSLLFLLAFAPSALAAEETETSETVVVEEETVEVVETSIDCGCGGGGWYPQGTYINVSTKVMVQADQVQFTGNYNSENKSSQDAVLKDLQSAYATIKNRLDDYGTVKRTGMYTYNNSWDGVPSYSGSLSIQMHLDSLGDYNRVEDILYIEGFSPWVNIIVNDTSDEELAAADTLDQLADKKELVYEKLLGYELGNRTNVNLYTWADSFTFDPETGMVQAMISADFWYSPEMVVAPVK